MKKALLLLTAIVAITACQSAQNPNSNATNNQNGEQVVATDERECLKSDEQQKVGDIFIDSGPRIRGSVQPISIKPDKHKVVWCIHNTTNNPVNVVITHIHELSSQLNHPFGNEQASDNSFITMPINGHMVKNLITQKAKKVGTYEYDVLLFDKDGKPVDFLDPQVVISDGRREDKLDNSNTGVRSANTANKNKK